MVSQSMNRQRFFVHIDLGDGVPVVAGFHEVDHSKNLGTFFYGRSYLNTPDAFAIDPINLPLIADRQFQVPITRLSPAGIHGALLDGGPDEWGRTLLNRRSDEKPVTVADYLVCGSGTGVGALYFSDTPDPVAVSALPDGQTLESLYEGALAFDAGEPIDSTLYNCLVATSGIGGARP